MPSLTHVIISRRLRHLSYILRQYGYPVFQAVCKANEIPKFGACIVHLDLEVDTGLQPIDVVRALLVNRRVTHLYLYGSDGVMQQPDIRKCFKLCDKAKTTHVGFRVLDPLHCHPMDIAQPLSSAQLDVLALVAAGWSNKEIAKKLCFDIETIVSRLRAIYRRFKLPQDCKGKRPLSAAYAMQYYAEAEEVVAILAHHRVNP